MINIHPLRTLALVGACSFTMMGLNAQSLYHQGSDAQTSVPLTFTVGAALTYDDHVVPSFATLADVTLAVTILRTAPGVSRLEGGALTQTGRIIRTVFNNKTFITGMNEAGYLPDGRIDGWRLVLVNLSPESANGQRVFYVMKKNQAVLVPDEMLRVGEVLSGSAETYRERVTVDGMTLLSGDTAEFRKTWGINGKDQVTGVDFRCSGVLAGRDASGPLAVNRLSHYFSYRWTVAKLTSLVGTVDLPDSPNTDRGMIEGSVYFSAERPLIPNPGQNVIPTP